MVELAVHLFVDNLFIRQCGPGYRTPVDHTLTAIDVPFVVEFNKYFAHRMRETFVHRKAFTLPVARCTELAQLADDGAAVLFAPLPYLFNKFFPAKFIPPGFAFLTERLFHLALRRNPRVVGAGKPRYFVTHHLMMTDEDVLQSVVQNMTQMEYPCYIRRRNYYAVSRLIRVGLPVKKMIVLPPGVPFRLGIRRNIGLRQLIILAHVRLAPEISLYNYYAFLHLNQLIYTPTATFKTR